MEAPAGVAARKDYSQLGRELLQRLGVEASSGRQSINAIYRAENGATIYVGNETAAKGPATKLAELGITHVVNCTDDIPNHCSKAGIKYYNFE